MPRCLREIVGSDSSTSQPPPEPTVSGASAIAIVSPRSGPLTITSRPRPDCRVIARRVQDPRGGLLDHFLFGVGRWSGRREQSRTPARLRGAAASRRRLARRDASSAATASCVTFSPSQAPPAAPAISDDQHDEAGRARAAHDHGRRVASEVDGLGEAAAEAAVVDRRRAEARAAGAGSGRCPGRGSRPGAAARAGRAEVRRRNSAAAAAGDRAERLRRRRRANPARRRIGGGGVSENSRAVVGELGGRAPASAGTRRTAIPTAAAGGGMKLSNRAGRAGGGADVVITGAAAASRPANCEVRIVGASSSSVLVDRDQRLDGRPPPGLLRSDRRPARGVVARLSSSVAEPRRAVCAAGSRFRIAELTGAAFGLTTSPPSTTYKFEPSITTPIDFASLPSSSFAIFCVDGSPVGPSLVVAQPLRRDRGQGCGAGARPAEARRSRSPCRCATWRSASANATASW